MFFTGISSSFTSCLTPKKILACLVTSALLDAQSLVNAPRLAHRVHSFSHSTVSRRYSLLLICTCVLPPALFSGHSHFVFVPSLPEHSWEFQYFAECVCQPDLIAPRLSPVFIAFSTTNYFAWLTFNITDQVQQYPVCSSAYSTISFVVITCSACSAA